MIGKSKKKKTPLYEQFGFKTEAEFRAKYPEAYVKRTKTKRHPSRLISKKTNDKRGIL